MPQETGQQKAPEFKPEYYWAFMSLILWKTGGVEAITQEQIEKFDAVTDLPEVVFDHDHQAWIVRLKKEDRPPIVAVPNKIRKKLLRTPKVIRN